LKELEIVQCRLPSSWWSRTKDFSVSEEVRLIIASYLQSGQYLPGSRRTETILTYYQAMPGMITLFFFVPIKKKGGGKNKNKNCFSSSKTYFSNIPEYSLSPHVEL
jgi:hypothetical protein